MIEANRRGKREQIIEAARAVLARDGLAACTVRAVAEASPLTKSAIHYYFDDIHEIVDAAMREHVAATVDILHRAADAEPDPAARLWVVARAYLSVFAEQPNAAFLWYEYWIDAGRRQAMNAVEDQLGQMRALFTDVAAAVPVADPTTAADAVLSWLLGGVVQQSVRPRSDELLHREFDAVVRATNL